MCIFRQDHYLHKDKDCTQLDKSSRIPFAYWRKAVEDMVGEDKGSNLAILHYVADRNF